MTGVRRGICSIASPQVWASVPVGRSRTHVMKPLYVKALHILQLERSAQGVVDDPTERDNRQASAENYELYYIGHSIRFSTLIRSVSAAS